MQPLEKMKKLSRGCSWTLAVVAAGSLLIWILDHVVPSSAVRNLPKGASDINEFYRDSGMSGDFIRLLKARIPREQVAEYAGKSRRNPQGGTRKTVDSQIMDPFRLGLVEAKARTAILFA